MLPNFAPLIYMILLGARQLIGPPKHESKYLCKIVVVFFFFFLKIREGIKVLYLGP